MEKKEALSFIGEVPSVDQGTTDMLLMHTGGEKSILDEIYEAFYSDADQMIDELIQAYDARQQDHLQRLAHSLSGVAGSVGALRLKEIARLIENSLKGGDAPLAFELAPRVPEAYEAFKKDIKNHI